MSSTSLVSPIFAEAVTQRPLRVLHVIGGLGPGGAETLLYRLATRFSETMEHEVVCLGEPEWYSEQLVRQGIAVDHFSRGGHGSRFAALPWLIRLVRSRRPDFVQGWMYRSNLLGSISALFAGLPSAWSIHCASPASLTVRQRLSVYASVAVARWLPDSIVYCSTQAERAHRAIGFRGPGRVIFNGYDETAFFPQPERRDAVRRRMGIGPEIFLIGSVARWHPEKDNKTLIAAMELLHRQGRDFRCLLVGHGMDERNASLMHLLSAAGLSEKVSVLGTRSDVADIMRALDLHVLSSRTEAFPNVVGEAMLAGTPCLVTNVGDAGLMVGDTGWVVPAANPLRLAEATSDALQLRSRDPCAWERRRADARARITEEFSFERMALGYEEVWRRAAGKLQNGKLRTAP